MTTSNTFGQYLVAGTYTHNNSTSKGIYVYDFDPQTGTLQPVSSVETANPSFQVVSKDQRFVYSVNETADGGISAFSVEPARGKLTLLNTVKSMGDDPCYLETDRSGQWLFASNYSSGSFSIYPILKDGSLGALSQLVTHKGSGPDTTRQRGPHVHSTTISPDNKFLFVCDLGTDQIVSYPFNARTGKVDTANTASIQTAPGAGPRHMVISKNKKWVYNIDEMFGTVNVYALHKGKLRHLQTADGLKAEKGKAAGADIHLSPDNKFLYTSQRSSSTIEVYKTDLKTGMIHYAGSVSTNGNFPRNFTIDPSGRWLLAANQKSDNITLFKINPDTGMPEPTGREVKTGIPVSLKWISK
ncbi:6-phosphogluconolactonase [Niabella drilacis]|uniref:6-phosphogluconolactonase n=2 Tax=Niabella drilacis (strain DSM 25811 / CCM 8410 / CCUG 62505 / LMG 26954 / E90) TaxID=1285928 RepID=A0A1G6YB28_NIADE|nr:6-phosphogluconolactonase [Niabella drilacis]